MMPCCTVHVRELPINKVSAAATFLVHSFLFATGKCDRNSQCSSFAMILMMKKKFQILLLFCKVCDWLLTDSLWKRMQKNGLIARFEHKEMSAFSFTVLFPAQENKAGLV